ncbi:hypothetical protein K2173_004709 [Erythroxylum novogranatense]|uniref:Bidirectional sugar transporter SWEET n=1 Tax=Erythroxylum novogranatense TaxID=1862640 RepID=A0AAV8U862_9ROSI|nr:hypothetical protein K2173_004709 [Erythroxylum novogranatense]
MAFHDRRLALVIGNVVSWFVYITTKSTEGFQSIPYSVALFSAMLLLYFASLKNNAYMLITINSIGCAIESSYLIFHMIYETKSSKAFTSKLLILFNVGAYGLIVLLTTLLAHGSLRTNNVGWICAVLSVCVFAAPLSIIRLVIRTKSAEYMPFSLSFLLTICAICWLVYGLAREDYYIATPNILGFIFGLIQIVVYFIYKDRKSEILPEIQSQETADAAQTCKDRERTQNSNFRAIQSQETGTGIVGEVANKPQEPSETDV